MFNIVLFMAGGLGLLYLGAEWLVRGSASLAVRFNVSKLVVGLTVVAFGTSAPELVVSVNAALGSNGGIAIGNVVGSNIVNIALILGLCAIARPVRVDDQIVRFDLPVLIVVSLLFVFFFTLNQGIDRWEGLILVAGLIAYIGYSIYVSVTTGVTSGHVHEMEISSFSGSAIKDGVMVVLGLAGLVAGAELFVRGSVMLADMFGVSQAVIGLTIVAIGTSLPELATSLVAAVRKESDIAVGNLVGSSIFNILCIAGTASLVRPLYASGVRLMDLYVMTGVVALLFLMVRVDRTIRRWEGAVMVLIYVAYMWLILTGVSARPAI